MTDCINREQREKLSCSWAPKWTSRTLGLSFITLSAQISYFLLQTFSSAALTQGDASDELAQRTQSAKAGPQSCLLIVRLELWTNPHSALGFSQFMLENEPRTSSVFCRPPHILRVWQTAVSWSVFGSKRSNTWARCGCSQSPEASDNTTTAGRQRINEVTTSEAKLNLELGRCYSGINGCTSRGAPA